MVGADTNPMLGLAMTQPAYLSDRKSCECKRTTANVHNLESSSASLCVWGFLSSSTTPDQDSNFRFSKQNANFVK